MPTEIQHTTLREDLGPGGDFLRLRGESVGSDHYFKVSMRSDKVSLKHFICELVSGSGATVQPRIHSAPPASADAQGSLEAKIGAPSVKANEVQPMSIWTHAGYLYVWPGTDAGADNVVDLEIHVSYGLE